MLTNRAAYIHIDCIQTLKGVNNLYILVNIHTVLYM